VSDLAVASTGSVDCNGDQHSRAGVSRQQLAQIMHSDTAAEAALDVPYSLLAYDKQW
jgi:hypothetical protein